MSLDKNPETQLDFVVIILNEQYFVIPSHLCIAVIDNARAEASEKIIGLSTDNTEVNCNRPGQLYQL